MEVFHNLPKKGWFKWFANIDLFYSSKELTVVIEYLTDALLIVKKQILEKELDKILAEGVIEEC